MNRVNSSLYLDSMVGNVSGKFRPIKMPIIAENIIQGTLGNFLIAVYNAKNIVRKSIKTYGLKRLMLIKFFISV